MMVLFLNSSSLNLPIGQIEEYSNLGLGLLGQVFAKIRGTDLVTRFQEVVFDGYTNAQL